MKRTLMLLTTLLILTISSCKKNKNGDCSSDNDCGVGKCDSFFGKCSCPDGYTGDYCEIFECDEIECQNNGVCESGDCQCPEDYYGEFCENYDPCYEVQCQNDGVCQNGDCECINGYYGDNCELRHDPNQVYITSISINFSFYNLAGNEWDVNTLSPDIYFVIKKGGATIFTSVTIQDANFINTHMLYVSETFDDPTAKYTIELWDEDTGIDGDTQDDFMGSKSTEFFPINQEINETLNYTMTMSGASPTYVASFKYKWDY